MQVAAVVWNAVPVGAGAGLVGPGGDFAPTCACGARGWVIDSRGAGAVLVVSAYVDHECVGYAVVDDAGPAASPPGGAGARAFGLTFVRPVFADEALRVQVADAGLGDAGPGDPGVAAPLVLYPAGQFDRHVPALGPAGATGWVWLPRGGDALLTIIARLDGVVIGSVDVAVERRDAARFGGRDGCYGFVLDFPFDIFAPEVTFCAVQDSFEYECVVIADPRPATASPLIGFYTLDQADPFIAPFRHESALISAGAVADSFLFFDQPVAAPALPGASTINYYGVPALSWRDSPVEGVDGGRCITALAVDRVYRQGALLVMAGWYFGAAELAFAAGEGAVACAPDALRRFDRPDVSTAYARHDPVVVGFVAVWQAAPAEQICVALDLAPGTRLIVPLADGQPLAAMDAHCAGMVAGMLMRGGAIDPAVLAPILPALPVLPGDSLQARGFVETARGVPGLGGLVAGWTVAPPGVRFVLADGAGHVQPIDHAARWHRGDIVAAMGGEFGAHADDAGLLQRWPHDCAPGAPILLLALIDGDAWVVGGAQWAAAPVDPVAFAQWAFHYPTPCAAFHRRLAEHDGPILTRLIEAAIARRPAAEPVVHAYGRGPAAPRVAVIIPLFRRHDFMMNQMIEFERDLWLKRHAEVIYVIDDPQLVDPVAASAERLFATHGVPFRTVWAGHNRGFSGANNVGARLASAPCLLLLNSDVVPTRPGWLEAMVKTLAADDRLGVLGARLHFPGGAVQHDGIAFQWTPDWGGWLNKHPGAGLCLPVEPHQPVERPAVTAACALLSRADYEAVGGLDETFLIGDFEDTDLCLKVRALGKTVACLQTVAGLVHLERQSFSAIGSAGFRDRVARFNAWQHDRRWGAVIAAMPPYDDGPGGA